MLHGASTSTRKGLEPPPQAVFWDGDAVGYVDQRALPAELLVCRASGVDEIVEAIATLAVRGAPAIGIFGAYGCALAARLHAGTELERAFLRIRDARPTAVNLAWAVDRVRARADGDYLAEAQAIHREQIEIDRLIGEAAVELFPRSGNVLTHCNTGPLATGGEGTALGAIVAAHRAGKQLHVFAGETRPLLQGARLTMYELRAAGVPATLIVDAAAALAMREKAIALAIVGADRIARNGDVANKIGTYGLAIAAAHHGIPFYVAAPRSTFDFALAAGDAIPIEQRRPDEIRIGPDDDVYNPAFDVTPGRLVTAFVTEYGIVRPPYYESIPDLETRPNFLATRAS
ncbi:MAG: S-methyl-5-thioribose-1-phosphate isomerase [Candidatus Eremiobacteraeota bacterium]|nr:S-methyl-5-thioribose-1-phosphate isomerase [Candidatus Eremiobacteraeota bacterium]